MDHTIIRADRQPAAVTAFVSVESRNVVREDRDRQTNDEVYQANTRDMAQQTTNSIERSSGESARKRKLFASSPHPKLN